MPTAASPETPGSCSANLRRDPTQLRDLASLRDGRAACRVGSAAHGRPGRRGLAAFAGLASAPHDSGSGTATCTGRHYHRGLQRVFYMSALTSVRYAPNSRAFYDRKRA
ncbi:transposase [Streptomyces aurantiogriseus]|uniref:transposase n=1 Tax=Streptomyces aurantiogriseus TaxID=66870 RepID=UPI003570C7B3